MNGRNTCDSLQLPETFTTQTVLVGEPVMGFMLCVLSLRNTCNVGISLFDA